MQSQGRSSIVTATTKVTQQESQQAKVQQTEARADLAAVEANIDDLVAEGIAAIDVDKIAHEARKEAIEAIAAPIYDHKQRAGETFRNDPVAWMTFAMGYIEDLQRQLGLR